MTHMIQGQVIACEPEHSLCCSIYTWKPLVLVEYNILLNVFLFEDQSNNPAPRYGVSLAVADSSLIPSAARNDP